MGVGDTGTWVGVTETGMIVFVGRGSGLAEGATATDRSHARVTMLNREKNKKIFFTIVLYMVEFPFGFNHSHQESKTPPPLEEFLTGYLDRYSIVLE